MSLEQLVSVILWSAEGNRRNAGRAQWGCCKWQVESLGAKPGSSKGPSGSHSFLLKKCRLELGIYRVPGQSARKAHPHPHQTNNQKLVSMGYSSSSVVNGLYPM